MVSVLKVDFMSFTGETLSNINQCVFVVFLIILDVSIIAATWFRNVASIIVPSDQSILSGFFVLVETERSL